jgi:hypothetical protein
MPGFQQVTPQDDPEFWDRPADPPPAVETGDYSTIYESHGILYRGNLAILKKTRTFYHYTPDGWVKSSGTEEIDA